MTSPWDEIDNADAGGGDFVPKNQVMTWCEQQRMVLCRILRICERKTVPGSNNEVDPVIVDMVVFDEPHPVVYRAEELINAGLVGVLRTKKVTDATGKEQTVARERGQLVAGHFAQYRSKKSGNMAPAINPATSTELATIKALAKEHGDLFDYYEAQDVARAKAAAAANGSAPTPAPATGAAPEQPREPVPAGAGAAPAAGDLPF
jgi:hypothetical protein